MVCSVVRGTIDGRSFVPVVIDLCSDRHLLEFKGKCQLRNVSRSL